MAEDKLARLRREYSEENRVIHLMIQSHMIETDRRFAEVGKDLVKLGERMQQESANSEERHHQLLGRMRLQDGRFDTLLGASQTQWSDLERRVSEIERRLGA